MSSAVYMWICCSVPVILFLGAAYNGFKVWKETKQSNACFLTMLLLGFSLVTSIIVVATFKDEFIMYIDILRSFLVK